MSAVLPQKLSERHRYIAWLELGGATGNEIAAALGLTPSWVSSVRHSPLYKVLLAEMRERVTDESIERVKEVITREAMNSVNTLIDLRDNGAVESATRRGAANDLLDRTPGLSKIHKSETDASLRIVFEGMGELMAAVAENEGRVPAQVIEGERAAVTDGSVDVITPKTLDEYIADYDSER